jgi:hypothetical protein
MPRRKNIIDRKFQLVTTFRIIGITIIAFVLIIAVTGIISTDNNRKIYSAISDLKRSMEKDKKTIDVMLASAGLKRDTEIERNLDGIIESHLENVALMHTNIYNLERILRQNRILLTIMIITGFAAGVALFLYLIRLTNRISGPLYVLTQHMNDIMNGRKPNLRELRKNDEFQEFYRQFMDFLNSTSTKK